MLLIINILILCIVLFLYIHIYNHIKTSNYLEIYEIEYPSKEKFEDLTNLKQPLLINNCSLVNDIDDYYLINNYPTFDLNLYNKDNDLFLKIKTDEFINLVNNDNSNNYLTYNNKDFLEETTIEKILSTNDEFFRPYNICSKNYDIIMGSKNNNTKLKYSINSRNLLYISKGKIEVTLCPPKDYKNLHIQKNYETLEYVSKIDIYNVDPNYKNDFNKVKFLRVIIDVNQVLVIPPYWFYNIKFLEENTIVFYNSYRTFTSSIAILPDLFIQLLQQNNLKLNIAKQVVDDNLKIVKNQDNNQDKNQDKNQDNSKNEEINKDL